MAVAPYVSESDTRKTKTKEETCSVTESLTTYPPERIAKVQPARLPWMYAVLSRVMAVLTSWAVIGRTTHAGNVCCSC